MDPETDQQSESRVAMKLQRNSRVVRWAYWGERVPERTSLCAIFWLTVLVTPMKILICLCLVWIIGPAVWFFPLRISALIACMAIFVAVVWLGGWIEEQARKRRFNRPDDDEPKPSVLIDGLKAVKGKVCPIVEIVS